MDLNQKNLLNSTASQLAEVIDFLEIARLLQLAKILHKTQIEAIMEKVESRYCRNLKLIDAIQDSNSPNAFEEFLQILEITEHIEALKLIAPLRLNSNDQRSASGRGLSMIRTMAGRFNNMSITNRRYPLGMDSGSYSSSVEPSSSSSGGYLTMIRPSNTTSVGDFPEFSSSQPFSTSANSHMLPRSNSVAGTRAIPPAQSTGYNNPSTLNPTLSGIGGFNSERHDTIRLGDNQNINVNTSTRTSPSRPRDLQLNRLNLAEDGDRNGEQEPLICWHPYAQPEANQAAQHGPTIHQCYPTHGSCSPTRSDSSSDSIIIDPGLMLDPNVTIAIAQEETKLMRVQAARVIHTSTTEDYKMTASPRGPCVIVNNIDFEGEIFPTRKGSDEDARRFDDIFNQLGFTVIMRRNQTADEMKQLFKEIAAQCKPEHDALFVFILSHGSEHGIYGTDGSEVCLESDIISCFDNRNCKALLGKPKVFVIQACRGRAQDCGGDGDTLDSIAWPAVASSTTSPVNRQNRVPDSWLPSNPSQDGFVSVRNELAGSWLGVALAYFIMIYAHEKNFVEILNYVTSDVIQRESSYGHIQSIELKLLGWTKNLYFNPGYYR